jgi:hypothetical protein
LDIPPPLESPRAAPAARRARRPAEEDCGGGGGGEEIADSELRGHDLQSTFTAVTQSAS